MIIFCEISLNYATRKECTLYPFLGQGSCLYVTTRIVPLYFIWDISQYFYGYVPCLSNTVAFSAQPYPNFWLKCASVLNN